jgi:hypothetical protein
MADGTLKVGTITTSSGSGTITLGQSGETITVPSGATFSATAGTMSGQNYPAFEAYLSANQNLTDSTTTKVQYDTEFFDTNGYYDNVTNYRFTPLVAGKYFVYVQNSNFAPTASTLVTVYNYIYKNGSPYKSSSHGMGNNYGRRASPIISAIINMNGTTDYIEGFAHIDITSGTPRVEADPSTYFGAYRIGA